MTISLNDELRDALERQPIRPVEFEDATTHVHYVVMTREQFRTFVYDDSELQDEEMIAAASISSESTGE